VVNNRRRVLFSPSAGKSMKVSPQGRVCQNEGCATVLSIYNSSADCSMHERRTTKSVRQPF
jgi:hypothetical protein